MRSRWRKGNRSFRMGVCRIGILIIALGLVGTPSVAQNDIGSALEREYGVVGSETRERRRMNDQLDRIVARMSSAMGYTPKSARILGGKDLRLDREINAMALPDGRIYVLAGLMVAAARTPDPEASVAFVVGHEIAHVTEKHIRDQIKGSILGAIGGALLAKVLGAGGGAVRTASDIGGGLLGGHYSRKHEYESDRLGIVGMHRAGYRLESASEMMQVLIDRYGVDRSKLAAWFGSHPNTENRVLRLNEMAQAIHEGRAPDLMEREAEGQRDVEREVVDQRK